MSRAPVIPPPSGEHDPGGTCPASPGVAATAEDEKESEAAEPIAGC